MKKNKKTKQEERFEISFHKDKDTMQFLITTNRRLNSLDLWHIKEYIDELDWKMMKLEVKGNYEGEKFMDDIRALDSWFKFR